MMMASAAEAAAANNDASIITAMNSVRQLCGTLRREMLIKA